MIVSSDLLSRAFVIAIIFAAICVDQSWASRFNLGRHVGKNFISAPVAGLDKLYKFGVSQISRLWRSRFVTPAAGHGIAVDSSDYKSNHKGKDRILVPTLPPIAWFLLATSSVHASPLNPQTILLKGPFFQGWLVRVIDHEQAASFIFIVGSFSEAGTDQYKEHYVFCGLNSPSLGEKHMESFPPSDSVTISGSAPSHASMLPDWLRKSNSAINVTWSAADRGFFRFTPNECEGYYFFENNHYNMQFASKQRIPWQFRSKSERNETSEPSRSSAAGPEGWLGYTSLLPCHYFVHSVGSNCQYAFYRSRRYLPARARPSLSECIESISSGAANSIDCAGQGFAHIEGNHGTFFPEGWTWSQSIAPDNAASFSLVAGKFMIGKVQPVNCVFYLRRRNGQNVIFRTTDGDTVHYDINAQEGRVSLNATSYVKGCGVEVTIKSQSPSQGAFAAHLHVPSATGFSDSPGCIESYTAVATVRLTKQVRSAGGKKMRRKLKELLNLQRRSSATNSMDKFLLSNLSMHLPNGDTPRNQRRKLFDRIRALRTFMAQNFSFVNGTFGHSLNSSSQHVSIPHDHEATDNTSGAASAIPLDDSRTFTTVVPFKAEDLEVAESDAIEPDISEDSESDFAESLGSDFEKEEERKVQLQQQQQKESVPCDEFPDGTEHGTNSEENAVADGSVEENDAELVPSESDLSSDGFPGDTVDRSESTDDPNIVSDESDADSDQSRIQVDETNSTSRSAQDQLSSDFPGSTNCTHSKWNETGHANSEKDSAEADSEDGELYDATDETIQEVVIEEYEFPLTALEFGGSFISRVIAKKKIKSTFQIKLPQLQHYLTR